MWGVIAEIGILGLDYAYHRWIEDKPPPPPPARYLSVPRTDAGAPYPLIFGRCRVRSPVVAWAGNSAVNGNGTTTPYWYQLDQFIVLGIPFRDGTGALHNMWSGEVHWPFGAGNFTVSVPTPSSSNRIVAPLVFSGGQVEFLDGKSTQQLVDPGTFAATTAAAYRMIAAGIGGTGIPGYRNKACVTLFGSTITTWVMDAGTQVPAFSFETSSYPSSGLSGHDRLDAGDGLNCDANPIDVLYDLLTAPVGKLGLDPGRIGPTGLATFQAAANTLHTEGHGFSRSWEGGATAATCVQELLKQIDATLYEDPVDGNIKIRLVRADYDPTTLPVIHPGNCQALQGVSMGGWTSVPNKVRITFPCRQDSYKDGSATAQNQANAAGQDGQTREIPLQMPGVCTQALANNLAARELAARSAPLLKCSVIVDRSFYTTVPGDVVKLLWPEYGISNAVMRVANVSRGTLASGAVRLDLMQDFNYVWRNQNPVPQGLPPLRTPGGSLGF